MKRASLVAAGAAAVWLGAWGQAQGIDYAPNQTATTPAAPSEAPLIAHRPSEIGKPSCS